MTGPRADLGQRAQMLPIDAHDEVPALQVLRAPGPAAGIEDPPEVVVVHGSIGEPADRPFGPDRLPDSIRSPFRAHGSAPARDGTPLAGPRRSPSCGASPRPASGSSSRAIGSSSGRPRRAAPGTPIRTRLRTPPGSATALKRDRSSMIR